MKDRLSNFMKSEGLSPGRLADILSIQPSSISHLVSGRNKPGFDFIYKIIQQFPRLSPDWLITGTGDMYRDENPVTQPVNARQTEIHDNNKDVAQPDDHNLFEFEFKDKLSNSEPRTTEPINIQSLGVEYPNKTENTHQSILSEIISDTRTTTKSIERIVIFFNNKTFREYISD